MTGKNRDRATLLKQHPKFLKKLNNTCQFCGAKHLGQTRDKDYREYAFHHTQSKAYGHERAGYNYLLLCKRCHWLAHLLGGELWLRDGNVRRQNKRAKALGFGAFPNQLQRGFNTIARSGGVRAWVFGAAVVGAIWWWMVVG
jgi:hypothetical protein